MDKIYDEYYYKLYFWSIKKTNNREDAEVLVNNVFLSIFEYLNKNIKVEKLENLIWKVAYNLWCTKVKKYIKEKNNIIYEDIYSESCETDMVDKIIYKEIITNLDNFGLTEKKKISFNLYYFNDLSIKEISKKINVNETNIKYYLFNARKKTLALISGITKGTDAHAFIQVIDNIKNKSYYFRYKFDEFTFSDDPFFIKIGDNLFSLTKIILNIKEINLKGEIQLKELLPIHKNICSPNIMGPFAYLSFMECNHSVISLENTLNDKIKIYNKQINFNSGAGYIEKDYGISFPKKYIWLQAMSNKPNTNIFLSIATIPFKRLSFTGIIGIVMIDGLEYRFATYYKAKIIELKSIDKDTYYIKIKQGKLKLEIELKSGKVINLVSPNNGRMNDQVMESLNSIIKVKLLRENKIIFQETFDHCTSELFW